MTGRTEFFRDRAAAAKLLLPLALFVGGGWFILAATPHQAIGWISLAFGCCVLTFLVSTLASWGPLVVIDDRGIEDLQHG